MSILRKKWQLMLLQLCTDRKNCAYQCKKTLTKGNFRKITGKYLMNIENFDYSLYYKCHFPEENLIKS